MKDMLKMGGFLIVMMIVASLVRNVAWMAAVGTVEADASWDAWRETMPVDPNLVFYVLAAVFLVVLGVVGWQLNRMQKRQLEQALLEAREESKKRSDDLIRFD